MSAGSVIVPLSDDRVAEIKEIFSTFDDKSDNTIANVNVTNVLRNVGFNVSDGEAEQIIMMHTSRNGRTTFEELCNILARYSSNLDEMAGMRFLMSLLDKERKGYVRASDVMQFCSTIGMQLTIEQAEQMVTETSLFNTDRFNTCELYVYMMRK